ncbi:MAG: DMT family transporter, partial [Gemmatimonadetes bacterium]|nr:DMT family transporter [Gemmatimonadota bacterium]
FGASVPLAKGLLATVPPQTLAGLLYLGAGLGLGGIAWARRQRGRRVEASLSRADLPWLALAIGFGGVVAPVLLLAGLTRTPASAGALLLNLEGVFTALIAWTLFRENVDRRIALGMAAIVAGGALLSWGGRAEWGGLLGPLAVAAACLCWGIDNNLTRKVSAGDPVQIAALKGIVAGPVNLGLGFWLEGGMPAPAGAAAALAVGFVSYGLSLMLYVRALRDLGAARTGAYFSAAPFFGAGLGLALWQDPVTPLFVAAATLMGIGLWLHLTERHEHWHVHEPLVHDHLHVHDEHHRHEHASGEQPGEPHSHPHHHAPLAHGHPHYPDLHHRHAHGRGSDKQG